MKFQERFQELLSEIDIPQKELANKLNIDPANITNWKTGKNVPSIELLYEICTMFHYSADYLLGITNENDTTFPTIRNNYTNNGTHNGNVNF